jgi:hypothetical protein
MANPLLQPNYNQMKDIYNAMRSGNPMQIFKQMAQNNPNMKPILNALNSGANPQQLFYNMCQQRGINPDEFIKNITG